MSVLKDVLACRNILIVLFLPLLLLPLALCIEGQASSCAYVMVIMAVFWLTEALPINVTALLPVFMFPLTGVMSADDVAAAFFNSTSLMFIGGMSVAVAIEEWNLHTRLALMIMLRLGARPAWLMLGLMMTSWFLSMWISNTATTAMMLPIASAIFDQLKRNSSRSREDEIESGTSLIALENSKETESGTSQIAIENNKETESGTSLITEKNNKESEAIEISFKGDYTQTNEHNQQQELATNDLNNNDVIWKRVNTGFCLCIAYASNVGGTGSMTGTVTNLILKGLLDDIYKNEESGSPVTFGSWLAFGAPTSLVIVLLSWLWLQGYFLRSRGLFSCFSRSRDSAATSDIKSILIKQYKNLGPLSFGQAAVCGHFVLLALLWITRDLGGRYGWASLFKDKFIKDSVPGIFVMCLLFIVPSTIPRVFCSRDEESTSVPIPPLLTWQQFNDKMPWGVVFLVGGGFSMAKASQVSGLSAWIGDQLSHLDHLEPWVLMLVLCTIVAMATEVTSNTATVSLILPIVADVASHIGLEPVYLMLPVTIAGSFAFMLPVATPANAIVFAYGDFRIFDMVKAGFPLNFIGILVVVGSMNSLGNALF